MRLFACTGCGQPLYFENDHCEGCGRRLGFIAEAVSLVPLEPLEGWDGLWSPMVEAGGPFRFCSNAQYDVCNWVVPADSQEIFCAACRANRTIPNLSENGNLAKWRKLEMAKHRLVYSLLRLKLPLRNKIEDPAAGLAFDFLSEPAPLLDERSGRIMTGHAEGVITINTIEADDAERERLRQAMAEPYRTLLGHFRHESGHYYWERLIREGYKLESFRELFGDERRDYQSALKSHYEQGPPMGWQEDYVTSYAAAHPWEDWAESFAHYLHMADTLETAHSFGLQLWPQAERRSAMAASASFDPYGDVGFGTLIETWLPLVFAVNSLNRSMGQPDLYPFLLTPRVLEKLEYVHREIRKSAIRPDGGKAI